ncbi:MAG TPA: hypothetical protein VGS04_05605 [Nitrososphaerales archaeon]|nr:hypothetical protein [Nitrososphaerales archaeon]
MPETRSEVNPPTGSDFVSVATFLPVRRWIDVVPFLRMSSKVTGQLQASDVIRFGLKTDLPRKRFWTLSVWADRESMRRFVTAEPHATAQRKFGKWAGRGAAFVEWKNTDGAIDWAEAKDRLKTPSFYYKA